MTDYKNHTVIARPVNLENDLWLTDKGIFIKADVFVGCAWEWDNREFLIGYWWELTGFWNKENCLLANENGIKLIAKPEKNLKAKIISFFK